MEVFNPSEAAMLFAYILRRVISEGAMRLVTASGHVYFIGKGEPSVTVRMQRTGLGWSLGLNPYLKIGEAYMKGTLTFEQGGLEDFLVLLVANNRNVRNQFFFRVLRKLGDGIEFTRRISPFLALRNASFHYDLPDRLYDLFLDADRQYSCAYFTDLRHDLERAQADKKRHIAAKLLLHRQGLTILDIGSGWGGLGLYLAQLGGIVTGITLSFRQYRKSRQSARAAGLAHRCHFRLHDYRQETGPFDRIVSVGMFEHVGKKNYDAFFAQMARLLADDGVALLHTISHSDAPCATNPFMRKYIFPGGYVPSMSEILPAIERAGLIVTDIEILRLHYAETLKRWRQRFEANRAKAVRLYGEAFYRKWQFYLVGCSVGFRYDDLMVAQIQLSKRVETLPLMRNYMHDWEGAHGTETTTTCQTA